MGAISLAGLTLLLCAAGADLLLAPDRRRALPNRHRDWWRALRAMRLRACIARQLSHQRGLLEAIAGPRVLAPRGLSATLAAGALLAGLSLLGWWWLLLPGDHEALRRAARLFAAPLLGAGWLSLLLAAGTLGQMAGNASGLRKAASLALLPIPLALAWIALMHTGTWFEWQERRTPIGYGTELFYAAVYLEYFREPRGLLITAASATTLLAPHLTSLAAVALTGLLRLSGPLGQAISGWLVALLARTRRGHLSLAAASLALAAVAIDRLA